MVEKSINWSRDGCVREMGDIYVKARHVQPHSHSGPWIQVACAQGVDTMSKD